MIVKKLTVLFVLAVVFIGTSAAQAEILTSRARLVLSGTVPLGDGARGLSGPQIAVKLWDITIAPSLHPRWNDGEFGLDFLLKFGLSFGPHPAEAPPAES